MNCGFALATDMRTHSHTHTHTQSWLPSMFNDSSMPRNLLSAASPSFKIVVGNSNNKSCATSPAFSHAQLLVTSLSLTQLLLLSIYVLQVVSTATPLPFSDRNRILPSLVRIGNAPLLHPPTHYLQHLSISDHRKQRNTSRPRLLPHCTYSIRVKRYGPSGM